MKIGKQVRAETDKKRYKLPPMFDKPTKSRIWGVLIDGSVSGWCTTQVNAKARLADDLLRRDWYRNGVVIQVHDHYTMQRVVHEVIK